MYLNILQSKSIPFTFDRSTCAAFRGYCVVFHDFGRHIPSRFITFLARTGVKNLTTPFSRNSFCPIVPSIFWVIQPASSYDPFYYTAKLHSKSSKSPIVLIKLHLLMPLGGNFQSFSILSVTSLYWPMEDKEQYDI